MLKEVVGIYRHEEDYTAESTTDWEPEGKKVPKGCILEVTHLSVLDKTTANKLLQVGYADSGGDKHYFDARQATQWKTTKLRGRIWLMEGERPVGKVSSPSVNDELGFTCFGLLYKANE